jgi:hypothetical protein
MGAPSLGVAPGYPRIAPRASLGSNMDAAGPARRGSWSPLSMAALPKSLNGRSPSQGTARRISLALPKRPFSSISRKKHGVGSISGADTGEPYAGSFVALPRNLFPKNFGAPGLASKFPSGSVVRIYIRIPWPL